MQSGSPDAVYRSPPAGRQDPGSDVTDLHRPGGAAEHSSTNRCTEVSATGGPGYPRAHQVKCVALVPTDYYRLAEGVVRSTSDASPQSSGTERADHSAADRETDAALVEAIDGDAGGSAASAHSATASATAERRSEERREAIPTRPGSYEIAPHLLKVGRWRVRASPVHPDADAALDKSIRKWGVLVHLIVVLRDGELHVVVGERRQASSVRTEQPSVPIRLMDLNDLEARGVAEDETNCRLPDCAWDKLVPVARILKRDPDATVPDIMEACGIASGTASQYRKIVQSLDPETLMIAGLTEADMCVLQMQDLLAVASIEDRVDRIEELNRLLGWRFDKPGPGGMADVPAPPSPTVEVERRTRAPSTIYGAGLNPSYLRSVTKKGRHTLGISKQLVNDSTMGGVLEDVARLLERVDGRLEGLAKQVRAEAAAWRRSEAA